MFTSPMVTSMFEWARAEERTLARYVHPAILPKELSWPYDANRFDLLTAQGPQGVVGRLYELVRDQKIKYDPELFNPHGSATQSIRKPATILATKQATCLDLAVLFATLGLANDLLPVIVVVDGHAFAGFSLTRTRQHNPKPPQVYAWDKGRLADLNVLRELVGQEYFFLECTGAAHSQSLNSQFPEERGRDSGGAMSFDRACAAGEEQIRLHTCLKTEHARADEREFIYALDIHDLQTKHGVEPQPEPDKPMTTSSFNQQNQVVNAPQSNYAGNITGQTFSGSLRDVNITNLNLPPSYAALDSNQLLSMIFGSSIDPRAQQQTARNYQPKPRMKELFEIITEPSEVDAALFRTDSKSLLTPYQVDYVKGRNGEPNVQQALTNELLKAKGKLLIQGRSGIGKTREVAEFAKARCDLGWTVCIAKSGGDEDDPDARLNALASFPSDLNDAKLLLIFDDLYRRVDQSWEDQTPYQERLEAFLANLEERVQRGAWWVIAITPSVPQFQKRLDTESSRAPWNRFGVYDLPEFTDAGLKQLLTTVAAKAEVTITDVDTLVANSDHSPTTLIENVKLARRNNHPLNPANWLYTPGQTWGELVAGAQARYPLTNQVYLAHHLLLEAGLPTRMVYVAQLSSDFARTDTQATIEGLVDMGLMGLRHEIVTVFSKELLKESLPKVNGALPAINDYWDKVIQLVKSIRERPVRWLDDLAALSLHLSHLDEYERAEDVAISAIAQGADSAQAYMARGLASLLRGNWSNSEPDVTAAIQREPDNANLYAFRGVVRNFLGNVAGLVADMDSAIDRGQTDAFTYELRGLGLYQLGQYQQAEVDFDTVIGLKPADVNSYLLRAEARQSQKNYSGAEQDLTMVLERGIDLRYLASIPEIERGNWKHLKKDWEQIREGKAAPISNRDDGIFYAWRGWMRHIQGNFGGAQADYTIAIERDIQSFFTQLERTIGQSQIAGLNPIKQKMIDTREQMQNLQTWGLYYLRGDAHHNLKSYAEAESDCDMALAQGADDASVYSLRATTRLNQNNFAAAEVDAEAAIQRGQDDSYIFGIRGLARLGQNKYTTAERDFSTAMARGLDVARIYLLRGIARLAQDVFALAEADFDAAVARGHTEADVYYQRGIARFYLQHFLEAENDFTQALSLNSKLAEAYLSRAAVYKAQGKLSEANFDLNVATTLGKDRGQYYGLSAGLLINQGQYAEAEQELTIAIESTPNDPNLYFQRGNALYNQQKLAEAENDFSTAIELGRNDANVYVLRCATRFDQGHDAEAESDADAAITRGWSDPGIYYGRGEARRRQSKYAEAEQDFDDAIARGRDDGDIFFRRGLARYGEKKHAEAERDFDNAIARGRDDGSVYFGRGLVRYGQEKYAEAERDFDDAIDRGESDEDIYVRRGWARYRQEKYVEAEADLSNAISRGISEASIFALRGEVWCRLYKFSEAEQDLTRAMGLGQTDHTTYKLRGLARLSQGKLMEAETDLDIALSYEDSANVDAFYLRGVVRQTRNNWIGAEVDFDAAIAQGLQKASVYQGRAATRVHLNQLDQAEQDATRASELEPNDSATHHCWGLIHLARQEYDLAIARCQAALKADDNAGWSRVMVGLVFLLAGRWEEAQTAYTTGIAEADRSDHPEILSAKSELEFWTARQSERIATPEAQRLLHQFREALAQLM